jgi:peptide/nickel transport system ATP-binding protein
MSAHLSVSGLRVTVAAPGGRHAIVDDVGFDIARGEVLALIGESGSGKTTIGLAMMGYARPGCRIDGGAIRLGDTDILGLTPAGLADLRGRRVAYIPQSAAAAFNPAQRLMTQVTESARIHGVLDRAAAERKAVELFRALALPEPETVGECFLHQVSGGQLQRITAAMALITDPDLVIFDEPTTALDVTTQIEVLRAFRAVVRERDTTAIYVSHDLAVVAQMADRIIVLRHGRMQEEAPTQRLLDAPAHAYTAELLAAFTPPPRTPEPPTSTAPLLEVSGLVAGYGPPGRDGMPLVPVLHDIGFSIPAGSVLGVIGESGCGKSTLARVIAGLLPAARGTVRFKRAELPARVADRSREQLRRIQIVFQSADTALNPAASVRQILARPLKFYRDLAGDAARKRVDALLDMVRLPAALADRRPAELSGGQKQRVNFARALAAEPELILCDEVTSALDAVVGAAVLDLLAELKRELGLSYLFISHDLSTVRAICDQVMILYFGRRLEYAQSGAMLRRPMHPYSDLLIASVPELRTGWLDGVGPTREAVPFASPAGCSFFPRCAVAMQGTCDTTPPPSRPLSKGAEILCHRDEASLLAVQGAMKEPP